MEPPKLIYRQRRPRKNVAEPPVVDSSQHPT
jgi:hypothetical protein